MKAIKQAVESTPAGSRYRSGRSPDWLKMKNPTAQREGEEDWGKRRWR